MKKVFIAASFLCPVLIVSCEKKNLPPTPAINRKQLIEEATQFFNREINGKSTFVYNSLPARRNVIKIPEWRDAYIQEAKNNQSVIVPLKFEKALILKSNSGDSTLLLEKQTVLVLSKTSNEKWKAEVVTWVPGKFLAGNTGHYSDYVFIEDWNGNSIDRYLLKGGKVFKPLVILPPAVNRMDETGCMHINWFLCAISASGSATNCDYLFSEDIGCDRGFAAINEKPGCLIVNELADAMVTARQLSSSSIPITTIRRIKTVKWQILKGQTWSLYSIETGVIKYITARARWEWESLTHNSISLEGWTGTEKISWSPGVGMPSFVAGTPNVLFAGMQLRFSVTFTPSVCDQSISNLSITRLYTNNVFWSADPG